MTDSSFLKSSSGTNRKSMPTKGRREGKTGSMEVAGSSETLQTIVKEMSEPSLGLDFNLLRKEREKRNQLEFMLPQSVKSYPAFKKEIDSSKNSVKSKVGLAMQDYMKTYMANVGAPTLRNHELANKLERLVYSFDFTATATGERKQENFIPLAKLKSAPQSRNLTMVKIDLFQDLFVTFL